MHSHEHTPSCHSGKKGKPDFLLWGSLIAVTFLYFSFWQNTEILQNIQWVSVLSETVFTLMNTIWWGIVIGIIMVAVLAKVPREFVISILGSKGGVSGIIRATLGGVLLDLCSHGILMVGAKLYERGATAGQMVAFLVASPWNSFSLTLVLVALIGLQWTLAFIGLSLVIAIIAGILFDKFVAKGVLPANPNSIDLPEDFEFWKNAKSGIASTKYDYVFFRSLVTEGVEGSKPVLRWILFGVVLAGLVRAFLDTDSFQTWFGPSLMGLSMTILVATIMEVCVILTTCYLTTGDRNRVDNELYCSRWMIWQNLWITFLR